VLDQSISEKVSPTQHSTWVCTKVYRVIITLKENHVAFDVQQAPTMVIVFLVVVPLDAVPLAVRSVRLLMLLLFIFTAFVYDMPVLSKLIMIWLYP
jgi:hypothetical protein